MAEAEAVTARASGTSKPRRSQADGAFLVGTAQSPEGRPTPDARLVRPWSCPPRGKAENETVSGRRLGPSLGWSIGA